MASFETLSDLELVALLKSGDHIAFGELYSRYFTLLYLHAYNRLKDKDEAKDVIQELFFSLWTKHETLDPNTNISNYLYKSVRNRILNVIAHKEVQDRYRLSLPELINKGEAFTDHLTRERQLTTIIEKEIGALPARMREVFTMSRKENLGYKEIAEKLNLSEQSVRSHVKNALRILRVKLGIIIYLFFIFYRL